MDKRIIIFIFSCFYTYFNSFAQVATPLIDLANIAENPATTVFKPQGMSGFAHYNSYEKKSSMGAVQKIKEEGDNIEVGGIIKAGNIGFQALARPSGKNKFTETLNGAESNYIDKHSTINLLAGYRLLSFAGIGASLLKDDHSIEESENNTMAYGAGVNLVFANNIYIGAHFRYFNNTKTDYTEASWTEKQVGVAFLSVLSGLPFRAEINYKMSPEVINKGEGGKASNFHKETTELNISGEIDLNFHIAGSSDILLTVTKGSKSEKDIAGGTLTKETDIMKVGALLLFNSKKHGLGLDYLTEESVYGIDKEEATAFIIKASMALN